MKYEWNRDFSVGDSTLDSQHKALLAICSRVAELPLNHETEGEMHLILNELAEYTKRHFRKEEQMLAQAKYPHLARHEKEHAEYEEKLFEIICSASDGTLSIDDLRRHVLDWWQAHILGSDKEYSPYLAK